MKRLLLILLLAVPMLAEQVFMSANGKTFHAKDDCGVLKRSKNLYTSERAEAQSHGLKPCRTCYKAASTAKPATNAWGESGIEA